MASGLPVFFFFFHAASVDYLQLLSVVAVNFCRKLLYRFIACFLHSLPPLSIARSLTSILCIFSQAKKNTAGGYNNFSQY